MIDEEQLRALRDHFAAGPAEDAGVTVYAHAPEPVVLDTLELAVSPFGDGRLVVCDGSANAAAWIGACAAVAEPGRVVVGWWRLEPGTRWPASTYAEFQGLRLALRLAAEIDATAIRVDDRTMPSAAKWARSGQQIGERAVGSDLEAIDEVTARLRDQRVPVQWDGVTKQEKRPHVASLTPMGVAAHRLAISACRMVRDEIDPAGDAARAYLAGEAERTSAGRAPVGKSYQRWRRRMLGGGE